MGTILENIQKARFLPTRPPKIEPISSASAEWAFRRTRSAPSLTASVRHWWDWGLGWLLTKRLGFVGDLKMNEEEEVVALGRHSRGTWAHVLYKVRFVVSFHSLPTTRDNKHNVLPTMYSVAHMAQCKPAALQQFAYTQSFQYSRAMAH